MLHLHDLNHVQIWLGWGLVDGEDGIDNVWGELVGECGVELGGERRASDGEK